MSNTSLKWVAVISVVLGTTAVGAVKIRSSSNSHELKKIFEYEDGKTVTNSLTSTGLSLRDIYPPLYSTLHLSFGFELTIYNADGTVSASYSKHPGAIAEYYPVLKGGYYLKAWGPSSWEPGAETSPIYREYYDATGKVLWSDNGEGPFSGGVVGVSPDGERVVYLRRLLPTMGGPNLIFKNRDGGVVSTSDAPFTSVWFTFTDDGERFLIIEPEETREPEGGTAVFDKDGRFLFSLDSNLWAGPSGGLGWSVIRGNNGKLLQVGRKVSRPTESYPFLTMLNDEGMFLQCYDYNGVLLWERQFDTTTAFMGLAENGEYVALVDGWPASEVILMATGDGGILYRNRFKTESPQYPVATISNDGSRYCVSIVDYKAEAKLFERGTLITELTVDRPGTFLLSPDGRYIVFAGVDALTIYTVGG